MIFATLIIKPHMIFKQTEKHFLLPIGLQCKRFLIGASIVVLGQSAIATDLGPYVPNLLITRQVSEADAFGEAMTKGTSEGILTGETAVQMQTKLQVKTPIRIKVVKGDVNKAGCQIMYTSMAVTGINAAKAGVVNGNYVFTNKLTICKDKDGPMVDVTHCDFAGRSCMPVGTRVN